MSFRWVASEDERRRQADGPEVVLRFAVEQGPEPTTLTIELEGDAAVAAPPRLAIRTIPAGSPVAIVSADIIERSEAGRTRFLVAYTLAVPPAATPKRDDQVVIDVTGAGDPGQEVPHCRVVLRRTTCTIETALIGLDRLSPETIAALLWQGWGQYRELVGLKRFTSGRGGGDVLVVRPRLRVPTGGSASLESSGLHKVLKGAWGSCLLIKTGPARKVRKEWDRCATFLASRLHPFLARCEAILPVRTPSNQDQPDGPPGRVTLISSFVGGDLVHPEPIEEVIRGASDLGRCNRLVHKVFAVLAPWQTPCATHPLGEWRRVYHGNPTDWWLFGKFDLTKRTAPKVPMGRNEFGAGLRWDTSFIEEEHLHHHLMGKTRDGLLYEIGKKIKARFSLTHGDLNPRNILCEGEDVWLIDFEHTGVAPTLMDYARLEANLRLWCLPLRPSGENVEDAARAFEARLLDHFLGSEGGLEPTRELAASLGADPDDLHRIAHIIAYIRQLAVPHCLPIYADRRDYLAVLYLTVLSLLQYAGQRLARPENDRVLVSLAWALEDVLNRILGRKPYDRKRISLRPQHLIRANWILPPGVPQRVVYFLDREEGRRALPWLAAARGVLQFPPHHLDVLDHTLLVLANVEALLDAPDPLAGFLNPAGFDVRVEDSLGRQGVRMLPIPAREARPTEPETADLNECFDAIRARLRTVLADESARLLLKWTSLLHDVGKPGTRTVKTEGSAYKVQFIGHEIYGLQLLDEFLRHLYPDRSATAGKGPTSRTPRDAEGRDPHLLERTRRLIECHHNHHHIVRRYTEHPDYLRAPIDGLETREVADAEFDYLAEFLGDGRIALQDECDFPLLILFGFADRLACRGPDNIASVADTARTDLAVLAFWALYPELKARRLRRKRKREQLSRILRCLSERLRLSNGFDEKAWEKLGSKVVGQLRHWYEAERKARNDKGKRGPLLHELLARGQQILDDRRRRSNPHPARVSV